MLSPLLWKLVAWAAGALAFAAVITGGIWWIYTTGRDAGAATTKARYETEIAQAQAEAKAEIERRVREYDAIVERANKEIAAAEEAARKREELINDYARQLENDPACALTPDDLRALERLQPR